jgi:hypothetical protein
MQVPQLHDVAQVSSCLPTQCRNYARAARVDFSEILSDATRCGPAHAERRKCFANAKRFCSRRIPTLTAELGVHGLLRRLGCIRGLLGGFLGQPTHHAA